MSMTIRERLLSTLRGGVADRIPWNIYAWLLTSEAGPFLHRQGLGLMGSSALCHPIREGVTIREERRMVAGAPLIRVTIETPVGAIWEEATIEPLHGSRWIRKYFITGPEDYGPAEYHFRHTRFEPSYGPWRQADVAMGDDGVVAGSIMALPICELFQYWMGVEGMAEGIHLYPDRFDALIDALNQHYWRQAELAAGSPAELIWFPESLSAHVIPRPLFQRYCLPVYERAVPMVRGPGKLITAHYDGTFRPIMDLLAEVDIPIIEAFTPPPMGDLSVAEAKAAWPDKVIWVNFPGCLFLEPAEAIYDYTLDLLRTAAPGGRLVLGCTEDFPAGEFEKTYTAMGRALADYQGYEW